MTRKLVVINMSNWADEAFEIVQPNRHNESDVTIHPGEYTVINPYDNEVLSIFANKVGEANGYKPPAFPKDVIDLVEEK